MNDLQACNSNNTNNSYSTNNSNSNNYNNKHKVIMRVVKLTTYHSISTAQRRPSTIEKLLVPIWKYRTGIHFEYKIKEEEEEEEEEQFRQQNMGNVLVFWHYSFILCHIVVHSIAIHAIIIIMMTMMMMIIMKIVKWWRFEGKLINFKVFCFFFFTVYAQDECFFFKFILKAIFGFYVAHASMFY